MNEQEQLKRIRELAHNIIQSGLQDGTHYDEWQLRNVTELLARSVVDLTNLNLGADIDPPTSLKATISKMKMAYNEMDSQQRKNGSVV
ncbi:hypothetical protein [Priestia abyssalis]|uniref:hypothetical protein n=1 Tax=Priestia abyssalis TaxID=1221450 RepID=UPI0009951D4D|nr:hypothetical protein [Priestia abyssalis]